MSAEAKKPDLSERELITEIAKLLDQRQFDVVKKLCLRYGKLGGDYAKVVNRAVSAMNALKKGGQAPKQKAKLETQAAKKAEPQLPKPAEKAAPTLQVPAFYAIDDFFFRARVQPKNAKFAPGLPVFSVAEEVWDADLESDEEDDRVFWRHVAFVSKRKDGVNFFKKTQAREDFPKLKRVVQVLLNDPETAARAYAKQTGRCPKCGLELSDPDSVRAGIGPECAKAWGWPYERTTKSRAKPEQTSEDESDEETSGEYKLNSVITDRAMNFKGESPL
jgi:hypothetical protein